MSDKISKFFLPCEFKPNSMQKEYWSVIEPFVYDVDVAYTHGILGIIGYSPIAYSIVEINSATEPLMGYAMTITHLDTVKLLDKVKGWNGDGAFNVHTRVLIDAYDKNDKSFSAWAYVMSDDALSMYRQIEQVKYGFWDDEDEPQFDLLEKLEEDDE